MTTNEKQPGDNEYLAAITGISDQTISPRSLHGYAIGDQISFRLKAWKGNGFDSGRIADINEARGTLLVETAGDIVEVVAGEVGKGGEVLPF